MTHDLDPEALEVAKALFYERTGFARFGNTVEDAITAYQAHIREREEAAFSALEMSGGQGGQSAAITMIGPPQTDGEPT
jgi:hypothetical protein